MFVKWKKTVNLARKKLNSTRLCINTWWFYLLENENNIITAHILYFTYEFSVTIQFYWYTTANYYCTTTTTTVYSHKNKYFNYGRSFNFYQKQIIIKTRIICDRYLFFYCSHKRYVFWTEQKHICYRVPWPRKHNNNNHITNPSGGYWTFSWKFDT